MKKLYAGVVGGICLNLLLSIKSPLVYAMTGYGGGSGTQKDPYLISTAEQLNQLQKDVNVNGVDTTDKYYKVTADIDLSGFDSDAVSENGNWTPIGSSENKAFKGYFDGNHHSISNMTINESYVAGLFGYVVNGTILNIHNVDASLTEGAYVGGLVGYLKEGQVVASSFKGEANGMQSTGGIVGKNVGGVIHDCFSTGKVGLDLMWDYRGGIVGNNSNGGEIKNSYSECEIRGNNYIGGIAGDYYRGEMDSVLFIGTIDEQSSGGSIGGIMGWGDWYVVNNAYWDIEKSGVNYSPDGAVGLRTSQLTGEEAQKHLVGFDFDKHWSLTDGYPELQWQKKNSSVGATGEFDVVGKVEPLIVSITVPTTSLKFSIDPNQEYDCQFIAPTFEVINQSYAPIQIRIKSFEQVTSVLNDVLPSKYSDWTLLNKAQSKDIALGLVPYSGSGWLDLSEGVRYVADKSNYDLGTIRSNSTVVFGFEAIHGVAFEEEINPEYRLVMVFEF